MLPVDVPAYLFRTRAPERDEVCATFKTDPETVWKLTRAPVTVVFSWKVLPTKASPCPAVYEAAPVWSVPHSNLPVETFHSSLLVVALEQPPPGRPKPLMVAPVRDDSRTTAPENEAVF